MNRTAETPDLLYNIQTGKCAKASSDRNAQMTVEPCNPNDGWQQFVPYDQSSYYNTMWNTNDSNLYLKFANNYIMDTSHDKAYTISGRSGNDACSIFGGEQCHFQIQNSRGNGGGAGFKGGAFQIWDWDSAVKNNHNKVITTDGSHIYNSTDGTNSFWLLYSDYQKCLQGGINVNDCQKDHIEDCTYAQNYLKDECKAQVCSRSDGSFLDKPQCRDWCLEHIGQCDTGVKNYCDKNPNDKEFCGCVDGHYKTFDKTLGIRPECNIKQCIDVKAYKFAQYQTSKCEPVNICTNTATASDLSQLTNVTQNCNVTTNNSSSSSKKTSSEISSNEKTTSNSSGIEEDKWYIIAIFATICLCLLSSASLAIMFVL